MTLEHDRREQLDAVGHELAVARFAQLAVSRSIGDGDALSRATRAARW
jgi:hypothetical protein